MIKTVSTSTPTIIIAAYNEASIISNTLAALTNDNSEYQIIVVCNGCTDNTAKLIAQKFPMVNCHSIEQASKALAIRYAESLNPGFPRLYLDADIILKGSGAKSLFLMANNTSSAKLFIPSSEIDTAECSAIVKRFYRAWCHTSYVRELGYGAGAYLVNKTGRERFKAWPELIADDAFVRSQFKAEEILVVPDCKVSVKAPKDLQSLIKVKTRSKHGNLELKNFFKLSQHHKVDHEPSRNLSSTDVQMLDKLTYTVINLTALILAKLQYITGSRKWHRDDSNRL